MRFPQREERTQDEDGDVLHDATWLYSYADLITQLLLFSILTTTLSGLSGLSMAPPVEETTARDPELIRAAKGLEAYVEEHQLQDTMAVDRSADRVVIRLGNRLLFESGRAKMMEDAREVLRGVLEHLRALPNDLRVEGHTDDVPMRGALYPSNWELSTARAISVIEYLVAHGVSRDRVAAAGYGQFHPIAANSNAKGRAVNRRVEIVIVAR